MSPVIIHHRESAADSFGSQHPEHSRHWELARYELPLKEIERKVGNRTIVDVVVGDTEKLAYVHRYSGKRVEFTRPRLDNMAAALEEADAKWQCELAFAEEQTAKRQAKSNIVGRIDLAQVYTCNDHVRRWNRKAALLPTWVAYPTKLVTPGAFGSVRK